MNDYPEEPGHFVAIGASAGGLEALQSLFEPMPNDMGAAFIVTQHLSPDFKSVMDELLSKHTGMPVRQAQEGDKLMANHVYLIPAGKVMRVAEGHIYLSDIVPDNRVNLPINELFRSLAMDQKHRAVGIVLSGTGSDGGRGVLTLKEEGGLVIAQDPAEAAFDGMPANAITTGSVDFVLPVAEIPKRLAEFFAYSSHANRGKHFREHLFAHSDILTRLLKVIEEKTELDFTAYKESTVARRIEHRLNINGLRSLEEYHVYIQQHPEEVDQIKQDLLIGVTQFFRDQETWDTLRREVVMPLILRSSPQQVIRVWCAGCATGEEAYSLAMLFQECLEEAELARTIKIFASDIDHAAIAYAANGIYPQSISQEIPSELLAKYFCQLNDGNFQVSKTLRTLVVFATHNLIQDPPFSNMDLVSCRNVLIYFQTPAQQKTLAFFHFALRVGGYLMLGSAESTGNFSAYFETVDSKRRLYQKNKELRIPVTSVSSPVLKPAVYQPKSVPQFLARSHRIVDTEKRKEPIALSEILDRFVPPTFILNNRLQVLFTYGDTTHFTRKMQPGLASMDLDKVLTEEALGEAISCCHQALRKNRSILIKHAISINEQSWSVHAFRVPENLAEGSTKQDQPQWVILSYLPENSIMIESPEITVERSDIESHRVTELEGLLAENQRLYTEALEDLDSTKEELQASNEELMAANEELQSTNEELQSVNEELYTVNSEYQVKIAELTEANNDLENLLQATRMAVLFLSPKLTIRRYTHDIKRFINIMDFDINRDFRDLKLKVEIPGLVDLVEQVNTDCKPRHALITTEQGALEVSVSPYSASNLHRGVVVSLREAETQPNG